MALRSFHQRAIHLDRDTTLKQINRDDQETLVWFGPDENALHIRQQLGCNSNALSFSQVGMGNGRQAGLMNCLNRFNLLSSGSSSRATAKRSQRLRETSQAFSPCTPQGSFLVRAV